MFARVEALPLRSWDLQNAKESATLGASREGQSKELIPAERPLCTIYPLAMTNIAMGKTIVSMGKFTF